MKMFRKLVRYGRELADQGQDAATSTGDFDVGSGQADGRHAHVEADVLVDEDALGRRLLQVT